MKPAVGGMPPSDSMNSSMAKAADGARKCKPLKSFSSSPMTSRRRPLVPAGPHSVEGTRRNLDPAPGGNEDDCEHEPQIALPTAEERRHHAQVRRARQPIHQRHPVQQDAERKGSEEEVLHGRLV